MPSPFPGMDPYLEGYLWPDVHHSLATQIRDQLMPKLRPRYVARIEIQVVVDESPQSEIGIMYPDVEIVIGRRQRPELTPLPFRGGVLVAEAPVTTPVSVMVQLPEVRLASVEIRDSNQNQLVTSIEILLPINKREPGLTQYREKWRKLREADVHILEIDLLRRGQRSLQHPNLSKSAYRVSLVRAGSNQIYAWTLALSDPLPIVPVPLRAPDADVTLDLGVALRTIYDRAAYDLSIDYDEPPPPPMLTPEELNWIKQEVLAAQ